MSIFEPPQTVKPPEFQFPPPVFAILDANKQLDIVPIQPLENPAAAVYLTAELPEKTLFVIEILLLRACKPL